MKQEFGDLEGPGCKDLQWQVRPCPDCSITEVLALPHHSLALGREGEIGFPGEVVREGIAREGLKASLGSDLSLEPHPTLSFFQSIFV